MNTRQSFEFDNQASSISSFSHQLLECLVSRLMNHHHDGHLLFKARYIIGELLNNAVKHSGCSKTVFTLTIEKDCLIIAKSDEGCKLELMNKAGYLKDDVPTLVTADGLHELYVIKENDRLLSFFCREPKTEEITIEHLHEHMGFLIIAKAADRFTYCFDNPVNTFTATLNLN
jgi:anti-sigma regulatory factor (Ser/Thr protein kinase)